MGIVLDVSLAPHNFCIVLMFNCFFQVSMAHAQFMNGQAHLMVKQFIFE